MPATQRFRPYVTVCSHLYIAAFGANGHHYRIQKKPAKDGFYTTRSDDQAREAIETLVYVPHSSPLSSITSPLMVCVRRSIYETLCVPKATDITSDAMTAALDAAKARETAKGFQWTNAHTQLFKDRLKKLRHRVKSMVKKKELTDDHMIGSSLSLLLMSLA